LNKPLALAVVQLFINGALNLAQIAMEAEIEIGSTAAQALRDSFGDRKPIDISRKITACVACRKQKIKCHMTDATPPCTRCKKRGLSCAVNRSLQMLLEGDVA
jgi:hypothetical protein